MLADAIRLLLFPALMAFAASSDLITMTISNRVSLALIASFFILAFMWGMPLAEIGMHAIRIRFVDEGGTELLGGEGTVQFGEPPAGVVDVEAGAVLVFDVPLPRPGVYAFEISLDGDVSARVPLTAGYAQAS